MNCLNLPGRLRNSAVTVLATTMTVGMTACSKDSPTEPSIKAAPGEPRASVETQQAPANDDFGTAVSITALPFTHSTSTIEATAAPDDPPTACNGTGATVWYQFTPTADVRLNANTLGSDYDTGIAVYTGAPGQLAEIACNDDSGSLQSAVTFDALAGETYFFMVGAFGSGAGGQLIFNVDVAPPPLEASLTIAPTGTVNSAAGIATLRGTVTCSRPASVFIEGQIRQRAGRIIITANVFSAVECDGETAWEAQTGSANGLFKGGRAQASLLAQFFDFATGESAIAEQSATVRLRGAGKVK